MARFRYAQNGQSFQEFSGNNLQTDREIQMIIRKLRLLPAALNKTDFEKILAEKFEEINSNLQSGKKFTHHFGGSNCGKRFKSI